MHRYRHAAMKVRALTLEKTMRLDAEEYVQITRAAAAQPRFALARQPHARAVLDAGGNGDLQGFLLARAALARAGGTRRLDRLARTAATGTGAFNREKSLLRAHAARAATRAAGV